MEIQLPSGVNFNRLKKEEMLWLYNHYCQHGHRYTEHPPCFLEEHDGELAVAQRIGCLDIEATNLNADFGYVICYSLKELGKPITRACVTPEEITPKYIFDKNVMRQFLKDIEGFTRFVVYYGKSKRFDIPYLRTRAVKWGLQFPAWKEYYVTDVYDLVKPLFKLHRNRLENIADLLDVPSKGHRLNPEIWQKGQAGNAGALKYIQVHCDEDVQTLEQVYMALRKFRGQDKTSI